MNAGTLLTQLGFENKGCMIGAGCANIVTMVCVEEAPRPGGRVPRDAGRRPPRRRPAGLRSPVGDNTMGWNGASLAAQARPSLGGRAIRWVDLGT